MVQASEIGTFNFAHSFLVAAQSLKDRGHNARCTHPEAPTEFMFWHAIELFLKAFLIADGLDPDEVRNEFGHRVQQLADEGLKRGLNLAPSDLAVIAFMRSQADLIELRYLTLGIKRVPEMDDVEGTCVSLYEKVGLALQQRGAPMGFHAVALGL